MGPLCALALLERLFYVMNNVELINLVAAAFVAHPLRGAGEAPAEVSALEFGVLQKVLL